MEYQCSECDFTWKGTSYTFDKVREHEKIHLGKNKYVQDKNEIMSIRCKVCNVSKISNKDIVKSNVSWECQNCGNLLDAKGYVVTAE